MIKFKDQSEKSKQVSMDSWLLRLLSEKHENKNNKQISTKSNQKVKRMGNITPTMDHYPRNG